MGRNDGKRVYVIFDGIPNSCSLDGTLFVPLVHVEVIEKAASAEIETPAASPAVPPFKVIAKVDVPELAVPGDRIRLLKTRIQGCGTPEVPEGTEGTVKRNDGKRVYVIFD